MSSTVLVAPVAAEILASALTRPKSFEEVAFATRQRDIDLPPDTQVFLYVAPDHSRHHALLKLGFITWGGRLGAIVPALAQGPRRGMHPDRTVRPPFAELYDYKDAAFFWHVKGLAPLAQPIPFERFRDDDGAKLYGGFAPQWIARGTLLNNRDATTKSPMRPKTSALRAA